MVELLHQPIPGGRQERGGVDSHYISLATQHSAVTVHQRGLGVSPDQSPHCMDGKAGIQKDEVSLKVYLVCLFPWSLCVACWDWKGDVGDLGSSPKDESEAITLLIKGESKTLP